MDRCVLCKHQSGWHDALGCDFSSLGKSCPCRGFQPPKDTDQSFAITNTGNTPVTIQLPQAETIREDTLQHIEALLTEINATLQRHEQILERTYPDRSKYTSFEFSDSTGEPIQWGWIRKNAPTTSQEAQHDEEESNPV